MKRLFFDIEVSPNLVMSWNVGNKLSIPYENIIQERAVICICYKWEHHSGVYSLVWNKGNDKKMLEEFSKIMLEADEVVGHNSDNFDVKWLRTRCLYHGIPMIPDYASLDTYKLSRASFRFNSNRLDYISKFLGFKGKTNTQFKMWQDIVLHNDQKSLDKMVRYCKNDVRILEKVYHAIQNYTKHKVHVGVLNGESKASCPSCGSTNTIKRTKETVTSAGTIKRRCSCNDCGKWFTVAKSTLNKLKL
jgi:DNA polymerase elongation subunit (family B)